MFLGCRNQEMILAAKLRFIFEYKKKLSILFCLLFFRFLFLDFETKKKEKRKRERRKEKKKERCHPSLTNHFSKWMMKVQGKESQNQKKKVLLLLGFVVPLLQVFSLPTFFLFLFSFFFFHSEAWKRNKSSISKIDCFETGKTSVCQKILDEFQYTQNVTIISLDSFYRELSPAELKIVHQVFF